MIALAAPVAPRGIPTLDGMRGIAVAWVLLFHYTALRSGMGDPWVQAIEASTLGNAIARSGYLGVDLFFLLSGFLLALPWLEGNALHAREFYARRLRRIVPAYYVHLAVLFALFVPLLRGIEYWRSDFYVVAWNGIAHALFLHNTSPLTSGSLAVNGALWTLAVEAQFYLLLPLLAPIAARRPLASTLVATFIAGAWQWGARHDLQWLVAWQMSVGSHWGWPEGVLRHLLLTQLPSYIAHFALGALLASLWLRQARAGPARGAFTLAFAAITLLLATILGRGLLPGQHAWIATTLSLGTLLFAASIARGSLAASALARGPLAFAGRVSYSAYLWQVPLLLAFNIVAPALNAGLVLPLYLAALAAVSWLSWRFIELRFWKPSPR
ncbi:MAG TPA: acyltransferase [Usitatibacter sp.]|nr:acyltransferase [Usitatibacter sp.]